MLVAATRDPKLRALVSDLPENPCFATMRWAPEPEADVDSGEFDAPDLDGDDECDFDCPFWAG